jgi:hypothetical protein
LLPELPSSAVKEAAMGVPTHPIFWMVYEKQYPWFSVYSSIHASIWRCDEWSKMPHNLENQINWKQYQWKNFSFTVAKLKINNIHELFAEIEKNKHNEL